MERSEQASVSQECAPNSPFPVEPAESSPARRRVGRPRRMLDTERSLRLRDAGQSWPAIARICHAGVTTVRQAYRAGAASADP
jgi:hypothetical protein